MTARRPTRRDGGGFARVFAKGRAVRRSPGEMNGTEARYAALLDGRKLAGEILGWWFESVTLKLAKDTRYTPDFMVLEADASLSFHEVKAMWSNGSVARDDAAVKYKVAAQLFPFRFVLCVALPKKEGGGWQIEEVG